VGNYGQRSVAAYFLGFFYNVYDIKYDCQTFGLAGLQAGLVEAEATHARVHPLS
jgi:hypothetical protein